MGMFDYVKVEYELPENLKHLQDESFQTKDFDCAMFEFTITKDGKLIRHQYEYRTLNDTEKAVYGEKKFMPIMKRTGEVNNVVVPIHGDYCIYAGSPLQDIFVRFTHGQLEEIREWRETDLVFDKFW